jgi:hypothetical protein
MAVGSHVDVESRRAVTRLGRKVSLNGAKLFTAGNGDRQATIAADFGLPF